MKHDITQHTNTPKKRRLNLKRKKNMVSFLFVISVSSFIKGHPSLKVRWKKLCGSDSTKMVTILLFFPAEKN